MPEGSIIVIGLLSVLIIIVLVGLTFLFKNSRIKSQDLPEVLHERIASRQLEIDKISQRFEESTTQLNVEREKNVSLREKLSSQETLLKEERSQNQEKLNLLTSAREQMSHEFKNLANEILEQKGKAFTELNQKNIDQILSPLSENIHSFRKKVEDVYEKESKQRFSLTEQVKSLQALNARISEDAVNLTNALKGESKTQGTWGEVILERVLENSGLTKGREYEVQVSHKNDDGRLLQPDVIVHLPDSKDVIIDSKVSLNAYERYCNESTDENKIVELKQHIQSIRVHIKSLSNKDYHKLKAVKSLDLVIMFLPVEAAFTLAMQEDGKLFTDAFERNILLAGPSTLLAILRIIQNIWRYEDQNKNALEIATKAGSLYDKFVGFINDIEEIGKHLGRTHVAYEEAHKKLSTGKGNLVTRVQALEKLGAKASKQIPASLIEGNIDDSVEEPIKDSIENNHLLVDESQERKDNDNE